MTEIIDLFYGWLDANSSLLLIVFGLCIVLFLALIFVGREAFAWFSKTTEIKDDLNHLIEMHIQLHAELKSLRELVLNKSSEGRQEITEKEIAKLRPQVSNSVRFHLSEKNTAQDQKTSSL